MKISLRIACTIFEKLLAWRHRRWYTCISADTQQMIFMQERGHSKTTLTTRIVRKLSIVTLWWFHNLDNSNSWLEVYSTHFSNKRGGWNKRGGGAKIAKSLNVEGVINIICWHRIKFYSWKWPWEKSSLGSAIISDTLVMKSINVEGGFLFVEGGIFQNR